jgi:hypothetical protein
MPVIYEDATTCTISVPPSVYNQLVKELFPEGTGSIESFLGESIAVNFKTALQSLMATLKETDAIRGLLQRVANQLSTRTSVKVGIVHMKILNVTIPGTTRFIITFTSA